MLKRTLLPILFVALLAACGKEEPAPAPAPETSAPAATVPEAPATPAAEAPATEAPAAAAPAGGGDLAMGEGVYKKTCFLCHGTGAGGAPMLTKADWDSRVAQGKDTLYKHAIEGFTGEKGMMPAKGGNIALSDDEVKASVDYMVSQLK
ncbi:MAG TPA: c-type cytochrome [Burkholderiales bacterium]